MVSTTTHFLRSAGIRVRNKVQVGDRQRPADILMDNWTGAEPAAVDVTVTHSLAPSLGLSAQAAKRSLVEKENRKLAKYADIFDNCQVMFVPMAFSTFGELSERAQEFVKAASRCYAAHQDLELSVCQHQITKSLQTSLMQENGRRLLAAVAAVETAELLREVLRSTETSIELS